MLTASTIRFPKVKAPGAMRLRLVIRRHSLPDAAIVWAIDPIHNPTISQLLEQINDVVPLESGGDWGLEDYSVEIKGSGTNYECLHFQVIRDILHENDEILYRTIFAGPNILIAD